MFFTDKGTQMKYPLSRPLAAIASTVQSGGVIAAKSIMPWWILLVGGLGIVVGLATYGWKVIATVGRKITELTPSRGFAAELGAASTVVIASSRVSAVREAEQIIVLDEGRIVERGTHAQLMAAAGLYARLESEQAESEALEGALESVEVTP